LDAVENIKRKSPVFYRVTIEAMVDTCVKWKFSEMTKEK
jgi:hypothetical protein